jgi:flavin reductase (DIM6/NTAB) family NADH-FMN oxidoreductase RutF
VPGHVLEFMRDQHILTLATASPTGIPRASTLLYGRLDCRLQASHKAADHEILIGEVLELAFVPDQPALAFLGQHRLVAR